MIRSSARCRFLTAGAVELRNNLTAKYRVELTPTAIFDYPTIHALAIYIASKQPVSTQAGPESDEEEESLSEDDEAPTIDTDAIRYFPILTPSDKMQ